MYSTFSYAVPMLDINSKLDFNKQVVQTSTYEIFPSSPTEMSGKNVVPQVSANLMLLTPPLSRTPSCTNLEDTYITHTRLEVQKNGAVISPVAASAAPAPHVVAYYEADVFRDPSSPYALWSDAFKFKARLEKPAPLVHARVALAEVVRTEIAATTHIANGMTSYIRAINSGEHHKFDDHFLAKENLATQTTIGQLYQIKQDLESVLSRIEAVAVSAVAHGGNAVMVEEHLRSAVAHAQPWIVRARATLVSAHVFYKVNYVLASDKKKLQMEGAAAMIKAV